MSKTTDSDFNTREFSRAHALLEQAGMALDKGDGKKLLDAAQKLQALAARVAGGER